VSQAEEPAPPSPAEGAPGDAESDAVSPSPDDAGAAEGGGGGLKGAVIKLLKLAVAGALLAWLFSKGALDPEALKKPLQAKGTLVLVLVLGSVGLSLSGIRWWILLGGEGIRVPLVNAVQLTWIGHFWNMVIPGAVSGDAVKMFYVGKRVPPEQREESWSTVFGDRMIGLGALVTLATAAALSRPDLFWEREELRYVLGGMLVVLLGFFGAFAVIGAGIGQGWALTARVAGLLPSKLTGGLGRAYRTLQRMARRPGRFAAAFVLSLGAHVMAVTNAWILGGLFCDLGLAEFASLFPVAMFSNVIPLTPGGGVGVGESVLGSLFRWSAAPGADLEVLDKAGVSVMLWFRMVFFAMAALGGLLYVFYKRDGATARPAS
jgi:uncharacterized protein (TIRG00374 family)